MMLAVLVQIACFLGVFFFSYKIWKNRRYYLLAAKIPKETGSLPILGLAHKFIGADVNNVTEILKDCLKPDPPISPRGFWFGQFFQIVINEPEHVQKVLNSKSCTDKAIFYDAFAFVKSMLVINTEDWRRHRKFIEPAFSPVILKSFLPTFNTNTRTFLSKLDDTVGKPEFDLSHMVERLTLENILFTSTGLHRNFQNFESDEYLNHVNSIVKLGFQKMMQVWNRFEPIYKLSALYQLEQKHVWKGMHKTADEVIQRKEREIAAMAEDDYHYEADDETVKKPQILIDQIFKGRHVLTQEEISHEMNVLIAGGYETISILMCSFMVLTAIHPEVQQKVYDEIKSVFKTVDEDVTDEHIEQLLYLEMVIKECLRFWTIAPISARTAMKDIKIGDYMVPTGTVIIIPSYQIHTDSKIWGDDVGVFRPERFSPEEFQKVHPYGFIPFLKGVRSCVGYKYAIKSVKVALSHIYRNFKFSTTQKVESTKFQYSLVAKPIGGYRVKVHRKDFYSD